MYSSYLWAAGIGGVCYVAPKLIKKTFPSNLENENAGEWRYKVRNYIDYIDKLPLPLRHFLKVTIPDNLYISASLMAFYLKSQEHSISNLKDVSLATYSIVGGAICIEGIRVVISKALPMLVEKVFSQNISASINSFLSWFSPSEEVPIN